MKSLLYIALIVSIFTYQFWSVIPTDNFFYLGNALFIYLICLYIYLNDKESFIKYLLVCFTLWNLIDELFFDPTKITLAETLTLIFVPLFWYLKKKQKEVC